MSDPDWSLLPEHKEKFFDLNDDYTRKDLKRAYGRLIKKFKPEQSPEEFRKIRDAYEHLEHWLSYRSTDIADDSETTGIASRIIIRPGDLPPSIQSEEQSESYQYDSADKERTPTLSLRERLESLSVEDWFLELTNKSNKIATDYRQLAFLSEVVPGQPPESFLHWLVLGLKAFPKSDSLIQMALQFCRQEFSSARLVSTLELFSDSLPGATMLYVTEPLWERLLKQDFPTFRRLWDQSIHPHRELYADSLVPFLVEHLNAAVWVAEEQWIADQLQFVDQHYDLLHNYHEYQLELTSILQKYLRMHRQARLADEGKTFPFQRFHDELRACCLSIGDEQQKRFDQFQIRLANSFPRWSNLFSAEKPSEYEQQLALVWEWVSHLNRSDRHRYHTRLEDAPATRAAREWMLKQRRSLTARWGYGAIAKSAGIASGVLAATFTWGLLWGLILLPFDRNPNDFYSFEMLILPAVLGGLFSWLGWKHMSRIIARGTYLDRMRNRAADFYRESHITTLQFYLAMENWLTAENTHLTRDMLLLGQTLLKDPALRIFRATLDYAE